MAYLQVLDAVADKKDTLMELLHYLHQEYIVNQGKSYLLLEGDAKLYEVNTVKK